MFAEQLTAAIASATLNGLDHLSRTIWQGLATGAINDGDAQQLAEQIHERRQVARAERKPIGIPPGRPSIFPPRRYQRSPDRAAAIRRRRLLAASGPMPPSLAGHFTTSELAVLRIIADAIAANGQCVKSVAEIAARAGVCRTTAQNAIREAAREGLLVVQERRREGRRNDLNIIRVVSMEWLIWIKRGSGFKKTVPTDTRLAFKVESARSAPSRASSGRAKPGIAGSRCANRGRPSL
jgi:DNA-binding MarR family transcriptional regulator